MPMRPFALSALLIVAAVGCGVPDPPKEATAPVPAETATTTTGGETKPTETATAEPEKPIEAPKPVEEDPAKLGLIIKDTKVGTGQVAEPGDTCYMLYTGKLKDQPSKIFDSTSKRGDEPFAFPLGAGQVIKGWDLGVKGMKEGGERTLTIPAALAYGSEAKGDDIPANSDLVFDIKLLAVLKATDAQTVTKTTVKPGTGAAVKTGDVVSIKYTGTLVNGKEFDSNEKAGGQPFQFTVGGGQVIPGFDLAVTGMKKGEVRNVTIPPELGYGPAAQGPIPANSILRFKITLVKIG